MIDKLLVVVLVVLVVVVVAVVVVVVKACKIKIFGLIKNIIFFDNKIKNMITSS